MNDQKYNRLYQEMMDREFIKWLDGQIEHQKKVFDNLKGQGQTHTRNRVDAYINALQSAKSKYCEIEIEKADTTPWTTIREGDPTTLPPPDDVYFLAIHEEYHRGINDAEIKDTVSQALYTNGEWQVWDGDDWLSLDANPLDFWELTPYAWQPWPAPPPYPGTAETQEEER
jgi:hypothetical protein